MTVQTARQAVMRLLDQYREYQECVAAIARTKRQLAQAKLLGQDTAALEKSVAVMSATRDAIGNGMTFATPLVWVQYKYEAYRDEAQPIRTLHALRLHCATPGGICHKRWQFLNAYLSQRDQTPLSDTAAYPDDDSLETLYPLLAALEEDQACLEQWSRYEYYQEAGAVKKWANYEPQNS